MRFSREIDNYIWFYRTDPASQISVSDITPYKLVSVAIILNVLKVLEIARVSYEIQIDYAQILVTFEHIENEIRTDKA